MLDTAIPLRTKRLILDALTLDDLPVVQADWGRAEVARMTATVGENWTEAEARDWVVGRSEPGPEGVSFAVRRARDRQLVGWVGMGRAPRNLGYLIGRDHWGHGYATEAARCFVAANYAADPHLNTVEAGVFDDNPASARVLTKLGFERVGPGDCTSRARVEPAANSLYRLTRAQFEATHEIS